MVLAGGNDQIELIKGIRKRYKGVEVILIDMASNVRATPFADKHLVISTMDFDAVLKAAIEENIDLIIVACGDQPLRTMAYVSEKMNLPCYLTYEQSQNLTNKVKMKKKMIESGIPTSKYKRIDIYAELNVDDLIFPLVVKPSDNNGSKGIVKIYTMEELKNAVNEAKKYTLSGELIVEEFKGGEELSIEAFILNKEPHIIIVTKNIKIKDNNNRFTIMQNVYVNHVSETLEKNILKVVSQISKAFEVNNVPLLIQAIINDESELSVIEFSARTGGGSKLFFLREMVGVDVIENLLDITEGKKPDIIANPSKEFACVNYIYCRPGIFCSIENKEMLEKQGYISQFYVYKDFGTQILSSNYSSDRPAGFLVKASTQEELNEKIKYVDGHIKILNDKHEDIMRHGIYIVNN